MEIKEFLYFDFDKAISIYSQLEDGLINSEESSSSTGENIKPGFGASIPGLKLGLEGEKIKNLSKLETKVLHHNVLQRIEERLSKEGILYKLNVEQKFSSVSEVLNKMKDVSYFSAEGWCTIENLKRLNNLLPGYNKTIDFIEQCAQSSIKTHKEYKDELVHMGVEQKNAQKEATKLRNNALENSKIERLDKNLIKGMTDFFKEYLEERIQFRMQPLECMREFQLLSQLKDECFTESNENYMHYCYGLNPNFKLSVFGIVTSVPGSHSDKLFKPDFDLKSETGAIELQLRTFIEAFENLKSIVSFYRYPNVVFHPIAIYRSIRSKNSI